MALFRYTSTENLPSSEVLAEEKIISGEDYSTLETADGVLKKTKQWATKFKKEAQKELEESKKTAIEEGRKEGVAQVAEHLVKLNEQWKELEDRLAGQTLRIAVSAAEKIIGEQLKIAPQTIVSIVKESLKSLAHFRKIKIYVHPEDVELLEKQRGDLKTGFEHLDTLGIIPNPEIAKGGCRIEYEGGVLNAELPIILENLERALLGKKGG